MSEPELTTRQQLGGVLLVPVLFVAIESLGVGFLPNGVPFLAALVVGLVFGALGGAVGSEGQEVVGAVSGVVGGLCAVLGTAAWVLGWTLSGLHVAFYKVELIVVAALCALPGALVMEGARRWRDVTSRS